MKKKRKKIFVLYYLIVLAIIIVSCLYTYSNYTSMISTEAEVGVAAWQIDINSESKSYTKEIDLADTLTSKIYNSEGDTSVVPGTSGVIELDLNYAGTNVATYYKISIAEDSLPSNLQLWANEANTVEFTETSETINLATIEDETTTSKKIYIYWTWDYTTTDETTDWMGKTIYVTLNIDVEQYTT